MTVLEVEVEGKLEDEDLMSWVASSSRERERERYVTTAVRELQHEPSCTTGGYTSSGISELEGQRTCDSVVYEEG